MEDSELEAIRRARMAELQGQDQGQGRGQEKSDGGDAEEEMRLSVLSQILSNEARERLSRIRIVRQDRAKAVEELLIRMARTGQIQQRISEQELVGLLDQISQQQSKANQTRIVYNKRRDDDEIEVGGDTNKDDSEDDFFD